MTKKSFAHPDQTRGLEKSRIDVVALGDTRVARFSFQPGWHWAEHVKSVAGTDACQARHIGVVVSGRLHATHVDGSELDLEPGDAYLVEPGHDAWVVGEEPLVQYEFEATTTEAYALPLEARLQAMNQVTHAILAHSEPDRPLCVIASEARHLVSAEAAMIALPHGGGELLTVVADGLGQEKLEGSVFPAEGSLSARVMQWGTTELVEDLSRDERAFQQAVSLGEFGPAIFVPLKAREQTIGSLTVANRRGGRVFAPEDAELVRTFAAQASLAVEYARAHDQLERMVLLEERERIAQDLHDMVIQRLFGIGMALQSLSSRRFDQQDTSARLKGAIDDLDATILDIRSTIFALGRNSDGSGLRAKVLKVAYDVAGSLGFRPHVRFVGAVDTLASEELSHHVIAVVREALSNVARHARASRATVHLEVGTEVILRVTDDGVGIPLDNPRRSGLGNLKARASQLGGTFVVVPDRQGGTTLEWRAPLV